MNIDDDTKLVAISRMNNKYMSINDISDDHGTVVTIKRIANDKVENPKRQTEEIKPVLFFNEDIKPLVLNKTKTQQIAEATGAKTVKDAEGCMVELYVDDDVRFGKSKVGGVRIRAYEGARCAQCGNMVKPAWGKTVPELIEISKRNLDKVCCADCMKKAKAKQE